jgi:hypothetical protein
MSTAAFSGKRFSRMRLTEITLPIGKDLKLFDRYADTGHSVITERAAKIIRY